MKLSYSHSGRQFFFLTLTVAGRRKILSQLVDEKTRPRLTEVGEVVKAALLALHLVNEAVAVSDFVIMPDHFHFIMIIDYGRDKTASPLYLAHRLLDAVERFLEVAGMDGASGGPEPRPMESSTKYGGPEPRPMEGSTEYVAPEPRPKEGSTKYGGPEPLPMEGSTKFAREKMAGFIREAIAAEAAAWRGGEERAEPRRIFDRDCYIELSFDPRQLSATRRYIKLNPARALWKLRHPDRFRRVEIPAEKLLGAATGLVASRGGGAGMDGASPRTPRLAGESGWLNSVEPSLGRGSGRSPVHSRVFHAMGDITLLGSPFFFHVRLTLKKTVAEHEAAIAEIVEQARRGRIPVSGFISPGEREALRRLKATPGARFVKLLPHALPPRYDPSAEDSREIAAGRLLLLSGCPNTPKISSLEMRRNAAAAHEFRRNCLAMNDLAAALCAR